jgi:hypothetical protein
MRAIGIAALLFSSLVLIVGGLASVWWAPADFRLTHTGPTDQPQPRYPATEAPGDSELVFEQTEVDLGNLKGAATHKFRFINRSQHVLRILSIRPSCNCTLTASDKKEFGPGEHGEITVRANERNEGIGPQLYRIDVEYQGVNTRQQQLRLRFHNRPDVIVPGQVNLRTVAGKPAKIAFSLIDFREQPLTIQEIVASSLDISAVVRERPMVYLPGWRYTFEVSIPTLCRKPGLYTDIVTLRTSDSARPSIPVRLQTRVVNRLRVVPETLRLNAGPSPGMELSGKVYIDDREGDFVEIARLAPSDDSLTCDRATEGTRQVIRVVANTKKLPATSTSPLRLGVTIKKPIEEVVWVNVVFGSRWAPPPP